MAEKIGPGAEAPQGKFEQTVTVLRRPDCSHGPLAVEKVKSLARELGLRIIVDEILVHTEQDAKTYRCLGSPTIQICGLDIELGARQQTYFGVT